MASAIVATVRIEGSRLARSSIRRLNNGWLRFSGARPIVYIFFAIVYLGSNAALARRKLIWQDEFYTFYLSSTRTWQDLWQALSTGADQHPPSFFYLTHLVLRIAGAGPVALRIPALAGFGLYCVCLYEIVRLMMGRQWAVPAIVLPLATPALYYATEARGYGLELGFATFSLLMWMLASACVRRKWTVPGLAAGLCLAVGSHYYAVLFLIPLATGELVRTVRRHSMDLAIWCAYAGAAIPLLLFVPLLLKARTYSGHFWALPRLSTMVGFYPEMLGLLPLVLIAASALVFISPKRAEDQVAVTNHRVPYETIAALTVSSLLPVIGMVFARLVTHAYTGRYFIDAIPGAAFFVLWGLRRILRNDAAAPVFACILCLFVAAGQWKILAEREAGDLAVLRSDVAALRQAPGGPLVINPGDTFYKLSFYAPRELAARLIYLADPHLSVHYLGQDTVDRELLDLAPWFPLHVVWWSDWWHDHQSAVLYGPAGGAAGSWSWIPSVLPEIGSVQMLGRKGDNLLLLVTREHVPNGDRAVGDPSGTPELFQQMPQTGASLCTLDIRGGCPVIDAR